MDTNLTAHYLATETERARLPQLADRGWLAEQAATAQPRRSGTVSVRHRIGGLMIVAGQRVQGVSETVMVTMVPSSGS